MVCVVQARMGSTRLPGKALELIAGKPLLQHVLERARAIAGVDQVVLATGARDENRPLLVLAWSLGIDAWIGSETDVLARVYMAAQHHDATDVVRVTGDCPLLDPLGSADVLRYFRSGNWDYVSNVDGTATDGLDTEVMTMNALFHALQLSKDAEDREHVTRWIRSHPYKFRIGTYVPARTDNGEKWSVDTEEDLERVRRVYAQKEMN